MIYAKGFVARFAAGRLAAIQRKSEEKDQPNLNVLFIHSMPFRGLAKMSNGLVTTEMTASILEPVMATSSAAWVKPSPASLPTERSRRRGAKNCEFLD